VVAAHTHCGHYFIAPFFFCQQQSPTPTPTQTNTMEIYSLYIINKSGGLIFQQSFSPDAPNLANNDHLRLGSTFHTYVTPNSIR
jgi:hypothetical protein